MLFRSIPSFFLSLQPNKERVQGKFITHVMSRSVSGAFLMIICVMSMYLTNVIDTNINHGTEFSEHYLPMCMIALTFSGLVMVYRVCKPLNAYRIILCLSMLALCITAYSVKPLAELLYTGWSELKWDYSKILIIVVVIEAAFPVSSWLISLMQVIMPSSTSGNVRQKHKHTHQSQQTPPPPPPPVQPAE